MLRDVAFMQTVWETEAQEQSKLVVMHALLVNYGKARCVDVL